MLRMKMYTFAFLAVLLIASLGGIRPASGNPLLEYSASGVFTSADGTQSSISGSMYMDGVVRDWSSPHAPGTPPSVNGILKNQQAFVISSFNFQMGGLSFHGGGGPFGSVGLIGFDTFPLGFFGGSSGIIGQDTFFNGSGDFTSWYLFAGNSLAFLDSQGNPLNVEELYKTPPAIIEFPTLASYLTPSGNLVFQTDPFHLTLTMVSPIPEPEVYAMFGVGLALLGWVGRKRKNSGGAPT